MDKGQLAEIAQKKREEIIKEFYEIQRDQFEKSAERGYAGCSVSFDTLDDQVKMALQVEEDRLSELITEVKVKLKREKLLLFDKEYISKIVFSWD